MPMPMSMIRIIAACALLTGCVEYNLVTQERRDLGGFSVEPQIEWSTIEQGGIEIWTVHGTSLEAIYFATGIEDGEPFFAQRYFDADKDLPRFREAMTAFEAMEFIIDTLSISGAGEVRGRALRPSPFGSHDGFRFDLEYLGGAGLELRGIAVGAVIEGKLYLLLFIAPAEYYFGIYGGYVEAMIDSLKAP